MVTEFCVFLQNYHSCLRTKAMRPAPITPLLCLLLSVLITYQVENVNMSLKNIELNSFKLINA